MKRACIKLHVLETDKKNYLQILREELQCTICNQIASSPIVSCSDGHIACGMCYETTKVCKLCKKRFKVNPLAERLSKRFELITECKYNSVGCTKHLKTYEMQNHIKEDCEFRPIQCIFDSIEKCYNTFFELEKYFQHTIDVHGSPKFSNGDILILHFVENNLDEIIKWSYFGWDFENVTIGLSAVMKDETFFWWFGVAAGNETAKKYTCTTTILQHGDIKKYCVWTLPVFPLHIFIKDEQMIKSGHVGSIYVSAIKNVAEKVALAGNRTEYRLFIKVDITKPDDSTAADTTATSVSS